ncbi:26S proteasome regulatory subunit 4-like protein B [Iris pallida]|uniref:26S proteasome regulatory subunit 4-like protein B n=1 Tax=Iris pallida TaxID=29817 RepID=A0AAX6GR25_IRIPA|nr:26S proteasome regulatory subunit 4-like protein B [Iris pallida]
MRLFARSKLLHLVYMVLSLALLFILFILLFLSLNSCKNLMDLILGRKYFELKLLM